MTDERISAILRRIREGEDGAAELLLPVVYDELRAQARALLRRERPQHSLQPTALVHEAYLRLVDQTATDWRDRAHFIAIATMAMRRVLIDHARRRATEKHGGQAVHVTLDERLVPGGDDAIHALELDQLLTRLSEIDERRGRVACLHLFGGLDSKEVAEAIGESLRTAQREWRAARAWLLAEWRS